MTKHRKPHVPPEERPYKVGYCKPDPSAGFKKGQIGNPNGRPRKMTLPEQLEEFLDRKINAPDGSKITIFQAILQAQVVKAMKGDTKAAAFILRLRAQLPNADLEHPTDTLDNDDRRILEDWAKRIAEGEVGE